MQRHIGCSLGIEQFKERNSELSRSLDDIRKYLLTEGFSVKGKNSEVRDYKSRVIENNEVYTLGSIKINIDRYHLEYQDGHIKSVDIIINGDSDDKISLLEAELRSFLPKNIIRHF